MGAERGPCSQLTGHRPQDIGDEDLHQGLVQDVVAVPHPLENGLAFTQRHQLVLREDGTFHFIFAAGREDKGRKKAG